MSTTNEVPNEVVIVKIKRHDHELEGFHGGVWKLAYADFVTAMMAFFLLMWLVNATTEEQRDGISAYFNPMALAVGTSGADGLMAGRTADTEGAMTAPDGEGERPHPVSAPPSISTMGEEERRPRGAKDGSGSSAFEYAAAQHEPPLTEQLPSEPLKVGETAPVAVAAFNDPFARPSERMARLYDDAATPKQLDIASFEGERTPDAEAMRADDHQSPNLDPVPGAEMVLIQPSPAKEAEAAASPMAALNEKALLAQLERGESFAGLQAKLMEKLRGLIEARGLEDNIQLSVEAEGLRIQIMDDNTFSMFAVGSAGMTPQTGAVIHAVAEVLQDVPNGVMITGHTDALPYKGTRNYTNWELSADRANAARRELISYGLATDRVRRVEGHGDTRPLIAEDPLDPRNRRISILVLPE